MISPRSSGRLPSFVSSISANLLPQPFHINPKYHLPRTSCGPSTLIKFSRDSSRNTLTHTKLRLRRGAALYRRGDVFGPLYAIRSGSFKSVGLTRAEHTKVVGLHLPADLVGLEA